MKPTNCWAARAASNADHSQYSRVGFPLPTHWGTTVGVLRVLITGLIATALMLAAFFAWGGYFEELLTGDPSTQPGRWDWLFVVGLLTLDVFLPIPATAVLASLGMAYGPWLGGAIGTLGTFAAGTTGYLLCRILNERAAKFLVGDRGMELGQQFFRRNGGWVIALSRWAILLPELLSCYAGLMRMPPRQYFAALLCGTLPMSFTYAWLGSTETAQDNKLLALAISAAVPVFLWGGWSWWNKPKPRQQTCQDKQTD
ncbi:MAG: VTT domain-containing protein [Verrucomicrobiota bacterium]|nr:VTT domain-containing protein [Verrucomicrobiota bacterium]